MKQIRIPKKLRTTGIIFLLFLLSSLGIYLLEHGKELQNLFSKTDSTRSNLIGKIPHIESNNSRILLLMIDGLAVKPFETALTNNLLPNISRILKSRPTVSMHAISTFPSATSPSVPEFVSGRYAEIENLPAPGAVHAFDREQRRVIRYATNPDTWQWPVVTLFDATRHMPAVTVFEGRWDGPKSILTQFYMAKQAVLEVIGAHDLAEGDRAPIEAYLKAVRGPEPPTVSLVVLNDFDMAAHFYGPESSKARDALISADKFFGLIVDTLANNQGPRSKTLLDETNIILFGDHGHVSSGQFVDLVSFFRDHQLKAVDVSTIPHVIFRERLGTLWTEWPDVILVSGGSNVVQVYLKQPSGSWQKPAAEKNEPDKNDTTPLYSPNKLASEITKLKGIDQVIWVDKNGNTNVMADNKRIARIRTKTGKKGKYLAYIVPESAKLDPFGYLSNQDTKTLVCRENHVHKDCFHSQTDWFDMTSNTRYPGAIPLVPKAFHPQRFTGDLMVTLKPGYSFIRNQKGDHGNLYRDAILTPMIINGPGVTPCHETHQPKLVDIYPSAAVLLGARPDDPALKGLDGRVLDCIKPPEYQ